MCMNLNIIWHYSIKMPRKSLMQDVIIYTYYVDYTMKLTSKRFDRCIEYRFSFLKDRKKYYLMLLMLDLCLRHLLFSEFSEINWICYFNIKQRRNYGKVSTPRMVQLDTTWCFLFFFEKMNETSKLIFFGIVCKKVMEENIEVYETAVNRFCPRKLGTALVYGSFKDNGEKQVYIL